MQYYRLIGSKIELTEEGKEALAILGITLKELESYPDEKLEASYWQGCKTFVDQALKNRKGISWLDDGRIPYEGETPSGSGALTNRGIIYNEGWNDPHKRYTSPQGRFPANLLVSDDVLNDGRVIKSSYATKGSSTAFFGNAKEDIGRSPHFDSGSFSRYFDLDKWWLERIKSLPDSVQKTFPFLIIPKASKGEKNRGLGSLGETDIGHNRFDTCATCGGYILQNPDRPSACKCKNPIRQHNKMKGNPHPTVKPLKLMSYLVTLGSRQGDVVLDPFMGTGTTGIACEILGRKFIGIDIDEHWCEMAKLRADKRQAEMELV